MFKSKIKLIDAGWNQLDEFKSRFNPTFDELIYSKNNDCYYRVINVIHSLLNGYELILVVEKVEGLKL